jgi:hypothetical protein
VKDGSKLPKARVSKWITAVRCGRNVSRRSHPSKFPIQSSGEKVVAVVKWTKPKVARRLKRVSPRSHPEVV